MPIFDDGLDPPRPSPDDITHATLGAVLRWIPGAGEWFSILYGPPFNRQLEEWCHTVAVRLRELGSRREFEPTALADNPDFVEVAMAATQAAARTTKEAKRQALRNAVLNAAVSGEANRIEQQLFVGLTDRLTESHLQLLWVFGDPVKAASGAPSIYEARLLLEHAVPAARRHPDVFDAMWGDLYSAGLVTLPKIDNGLEGGPQNMHRLTELGKRYVAFVTTEP
ncbi:MAG: hypothetical protein AB7O67_01995 [Vicinamibacterales bacterium]